MATDEAARHELYEQLSAAIGPRPTETLMSYLPPTGWSDIATRRDVDHLGAVLRVDVADRLRQQTFAMIGAMVTLTGVVGGAAALL